MQVFCISGATMNRFINVKNEKPDARKKGLRIIVEGVELDESNNLTALHIEYSGLHCCGAARLSVADFNKIELPEE